MKKRMIISSLVLLFVIGIVTTFWGSQIAEAASSLTCPRGQVNCEYPGKCHDYIDTNGNNICDRSETTATSNTTTTTKTTTTTAAQTDDSTSTLLTAVQSYDSGTTGTSSTEDTTAANAETSGSAVSTTDTAGSSIVEIAGNNSYNFVPIFLVLAVLYAATWILSAKKVLRVITHRKIWNIVLLVSMLVSALLGLVLILNIDFGTSIFLPFNMLFWHVEAGIALGIIGVFHIIWHWKYFTRIFKAPA